MSKSLHKFFNKKFFTINEVRKSCINRKIAILLSVGLFGLLFVFLIQNKAEVLRDIDSRTNSPCSNLIILGIPKSGTTWVHSVLFLYCFCYSNVPLEKLESFELVDFFQYIHQKSKILLDFDNDNHLGNIIPTFYHRINKSDIGKKIENGKSKIILIRRDYYTNLNSFCNWFPNCQVEYFNHLYESFIFSSHELIRNSPNNFFIFSYNLAISYEVEVFSKMFMFLNKELNKQCAAFAIHKFRSISERFIVKRQKHKCLIC